MTILQYMFQVVISSLFSVFSTLWVKNQYDMIRYNLTWPENLARVIRNKNIQKKTIKTNTSNFNIGKSRITRRQLHSVILPSRPGVNGWKMIQLTTLRRELVSASNPFVSYQSSRVSLSPYDLCRLLRHRNAHWYSTMKSRWVTHVNTPSPTSIGNCLYWFALYTAAGRYRNGALSHAYPPQLMENNV